jgi:hypothetical protein
LTIEYARDFDFTRAHPTQLYYGVSIAGWRAGLERYGYRFVTVEQNGVNAFFVDPRHFEPCFLVARGNQESKNVRIGHAQKITVERGGVSGWGRRTNRRGRFGVESQDRPCANAIRCCFHADSHRDDHHRDYSGRSPDLSARR